MDGGADRSFCGVPSSITIKVQEIWRQVQHSAPAGRQHGKAHATPRALRSRSTEFV